MSGTFAFCELDPDRALVLEEDARDKSTGFDSEIGARAHRVQIGARCAEPASLMNVAVEAGKPFLPIAVDVVGERVASLLHCCKKRLKEGADCRSPFQHQRAAAAPKVVLHGQASFHPFEVGQTVCIVPALHPGVSAPAFVVERVAALKDHSVDAAGAP